MKFLYKLQIVYLPFPLLLLGKSLSFGVLSVPCLAYENNTTSTGLQMPLAMSSKIEDQEPASSVRVIQRRMNLISDNTVKEMVVYS